MKNSIPKIAFFGSSLFSVIVLDKLKEAGFVPTRIVTAPDRPKGRKLVLTPTEAKVWAEKNSIPVLTPEKLDDTFCEALRATECDLFIVASYGKIIPQKVLDIPLHKTLNVHPSLLPYLRGATPLETAILEDVSETGVTIMRMDAEMDHGPIVAQEKIHIANWPLSAEALGRLLGAVGGILLSKVIPQWMSGKAKEVEQDHNKATFTRKIKKEDGLIDLTGDARKNYLKFHAHKDWPTSYFFTEVAGKNIRVIITDADYTDNKFIIKKVTPEGKKEILYSEFLKNTQKK
ncbi:methionyl-tRNA formyltransferase [Patescibacteria group bacterium]|nr:MAG: methionyl-tRNA formyltransferase [Patescibacteria group bacterium]